MRFPALLAAVTALALTVPAYADDASDAALYAHFREMDARVAAIGYRLATANVDWCSDRLPATGLTLSDLALYPAKSRSAVAHAYGIADPSHPIFVAAVAPGSPAEMAGLTVGTPIAAIDGEPLSGFGTDGKSDYARMAAIEDAIPRWLADNELIVVRPQGTPVTSIAPVPACATFFQVKAASSQGAAADGRYVTIDAALIDFVADDAELAAVLAHEFAHNILRHRARLDAASIDRGLLQEFGRNARLTRATETEADRLSVWLLTRAGYDPEAAVRFWAHWQQQRGKPLIVSATHDRVTTRIAAIRAEIDAMTAARAVDRDARPALLAAPPLR